MNCFHVVAYVCGTHMMRYSEICQSGLGVSTLLTLPVLHLKNHAVYYMCLFCSNLETSCQIVVSKLFPSQSGQGEFQLLTQFLNLWRPVESCRDECTSTACVRWVVEEPHSLVRAWCVHITDFANAAPQEAKVG